MDLVFLLLLPFAGALVAALLPTHARTAAATWAAVVSAAGLAWVLWLTPTLQAGMVLVQEEYRWIPRPASTCWCASTAWPGCSRCW
jgi:multicomponent K+:H+ antiporter subunit A